MTARNGTNVMIANMSWYTEWTIIGMRGEPMEGASRVFSNAKCPVRKREEAVSNGGGCGRNSLISPMKAFAPWENVKE